jgi:hypothetical protein
VPGGSEDGEFSDMDPGAPVPMHLRCANCFSDAPEARRLSFSGPVKIHSTEPRLMNFGR